MAIEGAVRNRAYGRLPTARSYGRVQAYPIHYIVYCVLGVFHSSAPTKFARVFIRSNRYDCMTTWDTGEICPEDGTYKFVGFIDKDGKPITLDCEPTEEERTIVLEKGKGFPPIKSCENGAYWRKVD